MSLFQEVGIEKFPLYTEVSSFQGIGIGIERFHISGGWDWNREVPLCTEASSFQGIGIGIERFHCVQRRPHFRGLGLE